MKGKHIFCLPLNISYDSKPGISNICSIKEYPSLRIRTVQSHISIGTRELKQTTTATATRTAPNKRLNEQNNSSACAFEVLVHFLAVLCKTTM